jgi:hypothetical protein
MKNGALSVLLLLAFVSLGCGFGKLFAGKNAESNSSNVRAGNSANTANDNSDPNGAPSESARVYKIMEDKANELGNTTTSIALDPKAPIKGKLAIVNKKYDFTEDFYIEGFDVYMTSFASDYDLERWGIKKEELAATPDEIDTLVRIKCKRGKKIGSYSSGGTSIPAYAMVCGVEMIDHKTATVFAQKTFTNNELLDSITTSSNTKDHVALQPTKEIGNYIKSFPRS